MDPVKRGPVIRALLGFPCDVSVTLEVFSPLVRPGDDAASQEPGLGPR